MFKTIDCISTLHWIREGKEMRTWQSSLSVGTLGWGGVADKYNSSPPSVTPEGTRLINMCLLRREDGPEVGLGFRGGG
jgi:hypothetical protein